MRNDATNMKSKLLLEFMPATGFKIKCNFAVGQNFPMPEKKTLFRLDPHLISSSQTVFLAKREQFSFSFMHKLGNQSEWETEDLNVLVEKGCMSVAEFQLKKSVVWKVFFASLHSRHILSVISDRFKSFEHNTCGFSNTVKRAPERCLAWWCYEHSLGGQGSVVNQLVWIPTDVGCDPLVKL